jgi:hypothetical protein
MSRHRKTVGCEPLQLSLSGERLWAQERADFVSNIVLHTVPLIGVVWMRARIEGAGQEGDAMDTICAFEVTAQPGEAA